MCRTNQLLAQLGCLMDFVLCVLDFCWKMAKIARSRRSILSRQFRSTPYPLPPYSWKALEKEANPKKTSLALEKKDWEDATCSVCMEFPHNAVLLLCSSHDKGCRPYMCGTSCRHSNCLDQFKKVYTKIMDPHNHDSLLESPNTGLGMHGWPASEKSEVLKLACPLCRGQVKGWTVVEPARLYLDNKRRSCMQEKCSFMGTYRELRKHIRIEHPSAKPREVDPAHEKKWRTLEHERERQDVISTIRSSMPQSVVLGDYVIEMNHSDFEDDVAGDEDGGDVEGGGRGISRSILYFFLQEGARLMRFQRNSVASEGTDDDNGYTPSTDGGSADVGAPYSSERDDVSPVIRHGRDTDMLRSDRRHRRRRRSRVRSVHGLSTS